MQPSDPQQQCSTSERNDQNNASNSSSLQNTVSPSHKRPNLFTPKRRGKLKAPKSNRAPQTIRHENPQEEVPMLQIKQRTSEQSFPSAALRHSADGRALIEELDAGPSTSYVTSGDADWAPGERTVYAPLTTAGACSDSDSEVNCSEITVQVHR